MLITRSVFFILFLFVGAFVSWADCDKAYDACLSMCRGVAIYDYVPKRYWKGSDTDFKDRCGKACLDGKDSCESADEEEQRCEAFKMNCDYYCPESVYNYRTFKYIASPGVTDGCKNACTEGENTCGLKAEEN